MIVATFFKLIPEMSRKGDRLFTDVLAGNRLGMFTILVEPLVDPAQGVGMSRLRSFEVWFSQVLGATLTHK